MKKRVNMRNRRGAARRGVSFSLFIVLGMSALLGFTAQLASPRIAQADSAADQDLRRRQLHTFAQCLTNKTFNEKDHKVKVYSDIFDKLPESSLPIPLNTPEVIVAGLDREKENGMMTCEGAIKQGVLAYKPNDIDKSLDEDENVHNWILKRLTGEDFSGSNTKKEINAKGIEDRLNALRREVEKKENSLPSPDSTLQQERYFPLAKICYTVKAARDTNRKLTNDKQAFYMKGVGYFYMRTSNEVKSDIKAFVGKGGTLDRKLDKARLGDVSLGFRLEGVAENFDVNKSDFYPIGSDIKKTITSDHDRGGIVDCSFIFNNREIALNGVTPGDNGRLIPPKGISDSGSGGVGAEKTGSGNYQCVVTPPLSWIACPIITLMVKALGVLEKGVENALQVPPLGSDGAFKSLHMTWAGMRDFANAFLVLIFLITIFAQVLPFDVDPYMVKKVLPKIIAAAICIQFSYFFVQIMFDISRVLGGGVGALIKSLPVGDTGGGFWGQEVGDATVTSGIGFIGAIAAGGAGLAAAIEAASLLIVPILLLLLSALISVITLFVTLQMRMIVIFIMTMIAPLAFLAWILPNTESYFKKWGTGLIKLLLMYPIIVFMIDSANLISKVSYDAVTAMSKGGGGAGGISDISKIMISIIPIIIYFMIPMTFKWAGGIFSAVAGAVQNQGGKWSKLARNNGIMKNSLADIKDRGGRTLGTENATKFGSKKLARTGARAVSGNLFSYGSSGRSKIAASIAAGNKAQADIYDDLLEQASEENPDTLRHLNAIDKGATAIEIDGKKMKVDEGLKKALVRRLATNGGDKELTKLINGTLNKDTGKREGGWYDFERGKYKEGYRKLLSESLSEGQRASLLGKAPHAIHGKGSLVYPDIDAKVLSSMNDENGDVAITEMLRAPETITKRDADGNEVTEIVRNDDGTIKFKDGINEDGAKRLVEQMLNVAHSSTMSGSTKKGVVSAIQQKMLENEAYFRNMKVEDGKGGSTNAFDLFMGEKDPVSGETKGGILSTAGSVVYTDTKLKVV